MADEFKNSGQEFNPQVENKVFKENFIPLENVVVNENQPVQESLDTTATQAKPERKLNQDKKNRALSSLSGGLAATIGAVAVGITGTMNVSMKAEFSDVKFVDSAIVLNVDVQNMEDDNTLTAYLYEGDKKIETVSLLDEDKDGKIEYSIALDKEHLKEVLSGAGEHEIKYRVDLKGVVGLDVERAFDSYIVRVNHVGSSFTGLTGQCHCQEDGCYHFLLEFEDDFNLIEFISARIEDKDGHIAHCTFSEDLHEEQLINVDQLTGTKGTLYVEYKLDGIQQDAQTLEIEF